MKKLLLILACAFALQGAASELPKLGEPQVRLIRALGVRFAAPTYIPEGFKLTTTEASNSPIHGPSGGPEYLIEYKGVKGQTITISGGSNGLGDPGCVKLESDKSQPIEEKIKSSTFGEMYLCVHSNSVEVTLFGDAKPMAFSFMAKNLNLQEAKKVLLGIRYFK